jgi:hypothetical protein
MIVTFFHCGLPDAFKPVKAQSVFKVSTGKFESMLGLIRTFSLPAEDGRLEASVHLWQTRGPAEAFFEAREDSMVGKCGHRVVTTCCPCPVVIDSLSGKVVEVS